MKLGKMLKKGLLTVCTCALVMAQIGLCTAFAEKGGNEKEYTYTVTLYAGKEGTFADGSSEVKITGLKTGDVVSFAGQIGGVQLKDSGKYYVKGVRESGKDNNTVSAPAFTVDSDREYVVAYGIKGDMVSYTVNYQDESGNALRQSEKFYGVVGDKPVVAFQYIDGYQPQAYNLTKTLNSNEADNVFTFTYKKIASGSDTNNGSNGSNSGNGTGTNTDNSGTGTNTGNTGNNGTGAANTNNNGNTGAADNAGTGNAANNTAGNNQTGNGQTVESADAETPKEQVDLDDEEVPKAKINADQKAKGRPAGVMYALAGIALAAILGIIILIVTFRKKKHADE